MKRNSRFGKEREELLADFWKEDEVDDYSILKNSPSDVRSWIEAFVETMYGVKKDVPTIDVRECLDDFVARLIDAHMNE